MSWSEVIGFVGMFLSIAFCLTVADDPRFFDLSAVGSRRIGIVLNGLVFCAGLIVALKLILDIES